MSIRRSARSPIRRLADLLPWILGAGFVGGAALTPLGGLSMGRSESRATGVSADGKVVVGVANFPDSNNGREAFRWEGGIMTGLDHLPGGISDSDASGVSADGKVVVGTSGGEAFRWEGGTMTGLGALPGELPGSVALGASADGKVVVGASPFLDGWDNAFRWEDGKKTRIGDLVGGSSYSFARGVSADGKIVVGEANGANGQEAFRWEGGVMIGLGNLGLPAFNFSLASDISANGKVVVGWAASKNTSVGSEVFRWEDGVMTGLGFGASPIHGLGAHPSVSADGKVVVGGVEFTSEGQLKAFRWEQGSGMKLLWDLLTDAGVDPALKGWTSLSAASAVSPDGRYLVGYGARFGNREAFLADLQGIAPTTPSRVTVTVPGKMEGVRQFVMISNPLKTVSNKVSDVIKLGASDDLVLYHYGATGFTGSSALGGVWVEGGEVAIDPGGGFFAASASKSPVIITFQGDLDVERARTGTIVPAGLSIRSSPLPNAGSLSDLGYPLSTDSSASDEIYQWDGMKYVESTASSGTWIEPGPSGPVIGVGESFWVNRTGPAGVWKQ